MRPNFSCVVGHTLFSYNQRHGPNSVLQFADLVCCGSGNGKSEPKESDTQFPLRRTSNPKNDEMKMILPEQEINEFCRRHHIRRLAMVGSALHGDQRPDSDLDLLVEFEAGHTPGFKFFEIEEELSRIIGRKVDLHTPGILSCYFRDEVLAEAQLMYGPPR